MKQLSSQIFAAQNNTVNIAVTTKAFSLLNPQMKWKIHSIEFFQPQNFRSVSINFPGYQVTGVQNSIKNDTAVELENFIYAIIQSS